MSVSVGVRFVTEGSSISLQLDGFDFDVARFEGLAGRAAPQDLEQALAVYRGDLLDGFGLKEEPFEDWLRVERERLRTMVVVVLDRLITQHTVANDPTSCIRAAARLLAMEPLREDAHRALMRSYAAQGRVNLALKQYERCRTVLQRNLMLMPEPETRELYEELRARRGASLSKPPPVASTSNRDSSPPPTHYVKSAGINIAYQVTGEGPIDLVYVPGWVSNLDVAWASQRFRHVLNQLGSFSRLIRIDKRGTGLSDRGVGLSTLEERVEDVRTVLDAVGSKHTALFGSSEGGPMCMLFAATYPERTAALILNGAYARGSWAVDYPWAKTVEQVQQDIDTVERDWGKPADMSNAAPSLSENMLEREWFASYLRNSASPADAIALWRWGTEVDVRDILPAIHVPTLIVQRTGDRWVKSEDGRYLAANIDGARYVELPGTDHVIWGQGSDRLVDEIRDFVTGTLPKARGERALVSVLSLAIDAAASGRNGSGGHADLVQNEFLLAGGIEIRRSSGTAFAVFQRPTRSIECAMAIGKRLKPFDLKARAAIHVGECEVRGDDFSGVAVDVSSRLLDHAPPGQIVVSRTVRDLVVGSGLQFKEIGELRANGLPGALQFFSVTQKIAQ